MPPTQDESKLISTINHSGSNSTSSLQSWGDMDQIAQLTLSEEQIIDEKFERILEKASVAFPKKATLETLIREAADHSPTTTSHITTIQLRVIGRDISLQHLPSYTPHLTQLTLDGSVLHSLRELGSGLRHLRRLSVNNCGLGSLDGILSLLTLEALEVGGNRLRELGGCVALGGVRRIGAKDNRIQDITTVSLLSFCEKLESLDIEGNPFVEEIPNYADEIKQYLPQLRILDEINIRPPTAEGILPKISDDKLPIISERFLPTIENPAEKVVQRPHTTLPNCTYSVKLTQKALSPRASSAKVNNSKDLENQRFELPKL